MNFLQETADGEENGLQASTSTTNTTAQSGANGWPPIMPNEPHSALHDVLTQPVLGLSWSDGDLYSNYAHHATPDDHFLSLNYSYAMAGSPADTEHHQEFHHTSPAPFSLPNCWPNQADNLIIPDPFVHSTVADRHPPDDVDLTDFFDPLGYLQHETTLLKEFPDSNSEHSWQRQLQSLTDSAATSPATGGQDTGQERIVELGELTAPSLLLSKQHRHQFPVTTVTPPCPGEEIALAASALDHDGTPRDSPSASGPVGWKSKAQSPSTPTAHSASDVSIVVPERKRSSRRTTGRSNAGLEPGDTDFGFGFLEESEGDDDSDVYQPSQSSSYSAASPLSSASFDSAKPNEKRGRVKRSLALKGSAALALLTSKRREEEGGGDGQESVCDSNDSSEKPGPGRKRKNSVIPLPVPVPGLAKKSRGRKVPFVAPSAVKGSPSGNSVTSNAAASTSQPSSARARSRRKRAESGEASGGGRSFVCAECGKCFVRGEHLKRHVRSIHTHDKPHPCPYEGCDKSFSRRDNLGQHVRVHLP